MKKIVLSAALLALSSSVFAVEDIWVPGYVWDAASNSGSDVWYGPGYKVTNNGAMARSANILNAVDGLQVAEKGSVALRDGRSVVLASKRFVSVAELLAGVGRVAAGPYGLAAAVALPFVIDWVAGDNQQNIRIANNEFEKKDPKSCLTNCKSYQGLNTGLWYNTLEEAAANSVGIKPAGCGGYTIYMYSTCGVTYPSTMTFQYAYCGAPSSFACDSHANIVTKSRSPDILNWLPASMDDIAPYMTPRVPAVSAIAALTSLGVDLAASPVSVDTVTPPPAAPPYVRTTQYPAPAADSSTSTVPGNPFSLPSNTPTVTSSSTSTTSVLPGSSSATGTAPSSGVPAPSPINSPKTSTTTSTYNPTTNQTSNTTNTTVAPQTMTETTNTTTNISNTTNSSSVTNSTSTTTTITNNTTNISTTNTSSTPLPNKPPAPTPDPAKTDCEKNPDALGCAKFGTPETPILPKSKSPFTLAVKTFSGSGGCPAPLTFAVRGLSYSVGFQPICDQLLYLKALMLMIAGVMAAYILADSFKVG
jgi:hypothetical protein